MGNSHKEIMAETKPERDMETMTCRETMEAHLEEEGTMACQKMEARPEEEPTSVDMTPEAAKREVPVEDATVMSVGEPKKKRHRDQKLAVEHRCQEPMNSTREKCESQKRLDIACRGASHRATVA
jgi:5'-3' exonuclease